MNTTTALNRSASADPLLFAADPRAENHERAVIGCCLFEDLADVRGLVLERLADTDLLDRNCRLALKAIRQLVAEGERVNYSTLELALERHGVGLGDAFLTDLAVDLPDPFRVDRYIAAVKGARMCRELLESARKVAAMAARGDADALNEARAMVASAEAMSEPPRDLTFAGHVDAVLAALDRAPGSAVGISTGLPRLDQLTLGLRPGQFIVVAGRPGSGKSAMALGFAREAAFRRNLSVAYVSLEMSAGEQVRRALSAETGVTHDAIRSNLLNAHERDDVRATGTRLRGWDLFIDDAPGLDADELERRVRSLHRLYGLHLVIVDYLQLVDVEAGRSREQEVAKLSRTFKRLARSLAIPVVVLSQLSRRCEERPDKRPMLHDLRESGALEQDCDLALMLYRDAMYNADADPQDAEIIVAKQRDGETGIMHCRFDGARMRFLP